MPTSVSAPSTSPGAATPTAGVTRLFWRLHFWAGLLTAPIVMFAALTGLLYVFTPQIEAWRHADLDRVPVSGPALPLDRQVEAAIAAHPDQALRFVVPAHATGETTQVYLAAPQAHHGPGAAGGGHDHGMPSGTIAYVDPSTGRLVGSLHEMARFKTWAKKLHSTALQGAGWRWVLELGASWMLVMTATGLYLWWPRTSGRSAWKALVPRLDQGRRLAWRDLHALVGVLMGGVLAVILVTGLTWSRHAGDHFREMQQRLGQSTPRAPSNLRSDPRPGPALSWQAAYERARNQAPDIQMQLTAPQGEQGVWRAENFDRTQPTKRFSLALDAYSGLMLYRSGWNDLPLIPQATAVGIPFHRAEFGVWNQVVLALAALSALFSVVSGLAMWWLRRPRGLRVGAPSVSTRHLRAVPWWLWVFVAALAAAMPVFAWSLGALVAAEGLFAAASRWQPTRTATPS